MTTSELPPPRDPGTVGHRLGGGDNADVHLWAAPAGDARAGPASVLKRHRGPSAESRAMAEAAALSSVDHEHIVRLIGVVDDEPVPGLILPRLSLVSAAGWLAARGSVTAGESVTLGVPILKALIHLERRGLDQRVDLISSVSFDNVLFDDRGAPILVGLRAGRPRPGPAAPSATAATRSASTGRLLLDELLEKTTGGDRQVRLALTEATRSGEPLDTVIEMLFDLESPVPLEAALPASSRPAEPASAPEVRRDSERRLAVLDLPVVRRVASSVTEVRPRVWLTAGAITATTIGGAILIATGSDPSPAPHAESSSPAGRRSSSAPAIPVEEAPSSSPPSSGPPSSTASALRGDDADSAASELLRLRSACLAALDLDCLGGVDQAGSPLFAQDAAAVDDPAALAELPVRLTLGDIKNRFGGSALYEARGENDEPADVLVTRTPTGWRLRSISQPGVDPRG